MEEPELVEGSPWERLLDRFMETMLDKNEHTLSRLYEAIELCARISAIKYYGDGILYSYIEDIAHEVAADFVMDFDYHVHEMSLMRKTKKYRYFLQENILRDLNRKGTWYYRRIDQFTLLAHQLAVPESMEGAMEHEILDYSCSRSDKKTDTVAVEMSYLEERVRYIETLLKFLPPYVQYVVVKSLSSKRHASLIENLPIPLKFKIRVIRELVLEQIKRVKLEALMEE